MIMCHKVYSNLYKQQPGNSQGMLSQEWAAIRTISVYLMWNRKDSEIDTELTIELLCIVVTGNGVRVCHHVD